MSSTQSVHPKAAASDRTHEKNAGEHKWLAHLPASRTRAITRGFLWAAPAALLGVVAISIFATLDFSPTGVSNRLTEYGIAAISLIFPVGALWASVKSLRWFLLGCWPGPVGVFANERELILALGPGGTKKFDVTRLNIQYAFECTDELTEEGYEAFLPEEQQMTLFLPRLTHPLVKGRINPLILDYVISDEASAAAALRPAIECWRLHMGQSQSETTT